ncbi:MAG: hypothetical protein WAM39_28850 [Bryobacteraceae bacterium]
MKRQQPRFERGAVVISIDTEQIWGHFDITREHDFCKRYPNAPAVNDRLLKCICSAGLSATWDVVGALSLPGSEGAADPRMCGLPEEWIGRIPAGDEIATPLWYRRRFVTAIRDAVPTQEIALHGGLTHMVWGNGDNSSETLRLEMLRGMEALDEIGVQPRSFVFPRDLEGHHDVLAKGGIQCYRGRAPIMSEWLGYNPAGSITRAIEEVARLTPPPIWPTEVLPGLWNIPASLFIYCMGRSRSRWVPLHLRLERVRRGVEAAIQSKGIFHLGLHPENLAEAPDAFGTFETILSYLAGMREKGVEILTMAQVLDRAKASSERS